MAAKDRVTLAGFEFDAERLSAPADDELGDSPAAAVLRRAIEASAESEQLPVRGWIALVEEDDLVAFGCWSNDFDEWTVAVVQRDGSEWHCARVLPGVRLERS